MTSVIIPAYNAEPFLEAAIISVLNQTVPPREVIVVDDGSQDRTSEIAHSFGSPVRCIRQENGGLSSARNVGIAEAHGEWIAFLDADDTWLPTKLERQAALLDASPEAVAAFTLTSYIDPDGKVRRRSSTPVFEDLVEALLLYSCVIGPPSAALIRRSTLDHIGRFDAAFSQCSDWDLWLRLAQAGPIVYVDEPLVQYRIHNSNMSKNIPLLERDTMAVLAKFFAMHPEPHFSQLKSRCYSNHWMILAGSYRQAGRLPDALRCLAHGLRLHPANIRRPLGVPARWLRRKRELAR